MKSSKDIKITHRNMARKIFVPGTIFTYRNRTFIVEKIENNMIVCRDMLLNKEGKLDLTINTTYFDLCAFIGDYIYLIKEGN